jgi:RNA polymerase sigma factor (sigma-70 family)
VLLSGASDERLVELARAGDERAFAAIVERYRAPLLRYCLGFVPAASADDAVQQTFINAYHALTRGRGQAPVALRPWLYRVARNAALNVARDPQVGLEELPEGLDGERRPDEVVQARERFRRVIGAVASLPPKQREVIVRHALEGESHERIASDLGMTAGSIRQLAHRARRTVREAAAALLPTPLVRLLPLGADAAEVGSGAALAKVAVAVVVVGAAGGGAVEVAEREGEQPAVAETRTVRERPKAPAPAPAARRPAVVTVPAPVVGGGNGSSTKGSSGNGSSARGKGSAGSDTSGAGSSGSSGSGSSGSSGSGSSGSSDDTFSGSSGSDDG